MTAAYRPSNWATGPAMVSITATSTSDLQVINGVAGQSNLVTAQTTTYVFDAVLALDHEQRLEKTQHPVQTGASISSHAYLHPAVVTMHIAMSDAMDAYSTSTEVTGLTAWGATPSTTTPFTGDTSKSVSAYQTLLTLQATRQLLTVTTRLRTYSNMLITVASPHEDYRTISGLRAQVVFEQVLTATTTKGSGVASSTSGASVSARPDATQSAGLGVVQPSAVSATTQKQFKYNPTGGLAPYVDVPGAGDYASQPGQEGTP